MPGIWGAAAPQSQPSDAVNNDDLHHDDEMVDDNQDVDVIGMDGNGGDYEYYNQLEDEDGGDRNEYEDVGGDGGDGSGWGEEEEPSEANTDFENQNETNASGVGQVAVAPGKDHGEGGEAERGARETTSLSMVSGIAGAASLEGDFTNPNDGEKESSENNSVATLAQAKDATTATVFAEASNQRCGLDVLSTAAAKATNGASDSVAASTNKQLLKANHPSVVDAPSASNQGEQRAREGSLDGAAMEPSTLSGTNNGPTANASESTSMEVRPHQGGVATGMIMLSHSSASADQRIVPRMTIPEDKNAAAGVAHKPPNNEASQAPDNSQTGVTVPEAPIHNSPKMLEARPMGTSNGNQQAHQVRHQVSEKTKKSSLGASQNTMFRPGHSFSKGRKSPGSQRSAPAMEGVTRMTGNGSRASAPNNRFLANNDGQRRPPMLTARPSQPALARTTGPSVTREKLFEASAATVNNPSGGMRASRGNPRYNQASNATATMGSNVKSNSNKAGESGHNASNGGLRVNQRSTTLGYSNTVRNPQSLRQHQDVSRGSRSMNDFSHQTSMTDAVSTTAPSHQQKQPPLRSRENLIAPETPPAHPSILRGGESGQFKTPDQTPKRRVVFDSHITTATLNEDRMAVTPGPMTALKIQNNWQPSEAVVPGHKSNAIGFMSMDEAENNERILPAPDNNIVSDQRSFQEDYADFQRMIRDLKDDHERKSNTMLNLNDLLATAHAETLQDQGDLAMFLGDIGSLNAELENQIGEYETFLKSFSESV